MTSFGGRLTDGNRCVFAALGRNALNYPPDTGLAPILPVSTSAVLPKGALTSENRTFEEPMNNEGTGTLDSSLLYNIDLFSSFDEEIFPLLNDSALAELQPHEQQIPVLTELQSPNRVQPETLADLLPHNQPLETAESRLDASNSDASNQSENNDTLPAILDDDTVEGSNDKADKASNTDLKNQKINRQVIKRHQKRENET